MHLDLAWAERKGTTQRFLEFQLDGQALSELHKLDLISCLGWFVPEQDHLAAQRLLGEAPSDIDDRVSLCVCPECGDIFCGALTARITHSDQEVIWSDFAHSWFDADSTQWQHDPLTLNKPQYHFNAPAYHHTITNRPR